MNPDTNKFERLYLDKDEMEQLQQHNAELEQVFLQRTLVRPDGTPVPKHWSTFQVGENYVINNYTFKCQYIGETSILFEPVSPIEIKRG